jgi:hypothetical protein
MTTINSPAKQRRKLQSPVRSWTLLLWAMLLGVCMTQPCRGIWIDNDIPTGTVGHFSVDVYDGGQAYEGYVTAQRLASGDLYTENVVYSYLAFVETGTGMVFQLPVDTTGTLTGDDEVTSTGSFPGSNGNTVNWKVVSYIPAGALQMANVFTFWTDQGTLGNLKFYQYLDEDLEDFTDDIFFTRGSAESANLELYTVDSNEVYGVSQSGAFNTAQGLRDAAFIGWAADKYYDLLDSILGSTVTVSVAGVVDTVDLPPLTHPVVGPAYGPRDISTTLAWSFNSSATQAVIVTTLGGVPSGKSLAKACASTEAGSLLVFPLVDNVSAQTIIEIANHGHSDVCLQGMMVVRPAGVIPTPEAGGFVKEDFFIHLTAKEPLYWNTSQAYNRVDADGVRTQIRGYPRLTGFCFVWAVDSKVAQKEIGWNFLTGDALVYGAGHGFSYNAYAHQGINVVGDRVLNLDGAEYCMAPSQIMTQGFAAGLVNGLEGSLAVCALDIDFIQSVQPEFDINVSVYNQDETYHSRHLKCYQFAQYDLAKDLQLHLSQIFTPKWQLTATSTNPMWAVFFQSAGPMNWEGGIFQHPESGVPTRVVLPPVPQAPEG